MKEGTAKFAETAGENDRQMQKVIQKQASHSNVSFLPSFVLFFSLSISSRNQKFSY